MIKNRIFSAFLAVGLSLNCIALPVSAVDDSSGFITNKEFENLIPIIENTDNYMISVSDCESSIDLSELQSETCNDYGYKDTELRENTEGRKKFYNDIMKEMQDLWNSNQDIKAINNSSIGDIYVIGMCILENYNISFEEAAAVYDTFKSDNPIFYCASNEFLGFPVGNKTYIAISSFSDFASADVRNECNNSIPEYIESYASCVNGESAFEDAKAIHDRLIMTTDFPYEEDGVTPVNNGKTHSIIGAIEGSGVCESYARTYQMLCTYYGIDNLFVKSTSHAWNIVKLDDGVYYNVDCTWDDLGNQASYKYFAAGTDTFYQNHTPCTTEDIGMNFQYELPEISYTRYQSPEDIETTTEATTTTTEATTTTTTEATTTTTTEATTTTTTEATTTTTTEATTTTTTEATTTTTTEATTTTTTEATTTTTTEATTTTTTEATTTTTTEATTTTTTTTVPLKIRGDLNNDGIFNVADVIILQKYLLCKIELDDLKNADFYQDNIINIFDLYSMKENLIQAN